MKYFMSIDPPTEKYRQDNKAQKQMLKSIRKAFKKEK